MNKKLVILYFRDNSVHIYDYPHYHSEEELEEYIEELGFETGNSQWMVTVEYAEGEQAPIYIY